MRNIMMILVTMLCMFGCKSPYAQSGACATAIDSVEYVHKSFEDSLVQIAYTLNYRDSEYRDSLNGTRALLVVREAYISTLIDSISTLNNRIKYSDYRNGRIVTKIQYYIDITNQRPLNKKYFFGWVQRAVRQEK